MTQENLKSLAEDILLRSKDDVSDDKEILEKLRGKLIIVKETSQIEIASKFQQPQERIVLYLIGKLMGHKVLNQFETSTANVEELSNNLNLSPQALSRPLGILLQTMIQKAGEGYQVKAFKVLDFLNSIDEKSEKSSTGISKKRAKRKQSRTTTKEKEEQETSNEELQFSSQGLQDLSDFLNISAEKLRRIFFFRENDLRIINTKVVQAKKTKEMQLEVSLLHLLAYKYCFNLEKCPAALLRQKLKLLGVKSLVNLTTNLHKYQEYIIHEAGKKGSIENFFLITLPGEERIKERLEEYFSES